MSRSKSPIKWTGGKSWLSEKVGQLRSGHMDSRFVEMFAGGLGLSFALEPREVLANDINRQLINFYCWLKTHPAVEMQLDNTPESFYSNRARYNHLTTTKDQSRKACKESADLFYYLNRTCFNGLYRVNQKGEFNAPYGKYKNPTLLQDLSPYSRKIQEWSFSCQDFRELDLRTGDFLVADAPYDQTFTSYTQDGFDWQDQLGLAHLIAAHDGPVIATNSATPRIIELYASLGFSVELIERRHKINPSGESGDRPQEVFCTKNL